MARWMARSKRVSKDFPTTFRLMFLKRILSNFMQSSYRTAFGGFAVMLIALAAYCYSREIKVVCNQLQPGSKYSTEQLKNVCESLLLNPTSSNQQQYSADNEICEMKPVSYFEKSCSDIAANYITDASSLPEDELSVSIAFGILIFKDVWQVERLLRSVYRPHHLYCVHVDKKSDQSVFAAITHIARCFPNVFVASERIDVGWCESTQLDAELSCMRELLQWKSKWSWFINLTGQEFPLRSMWQLTRILRALNGTNSIEVAGQWFADEHRKRPLRPFTDSHQMEATLGATHIIAVRGFVDYAVHSAEAKAFRDFLVGSHCPEEAFFNTLNSSPRLQIPGGMTVTQSNLDGTRQFINRLKRFWRQPEGYPPCESGRWKHDVCIFGVEDLSFMTDSARRELFVNKLYWNFQHLALDCLEWWHAKSTLEEYANFAAHKTMPEVPLAFYREYAQQFRPTGDSA